MLENNKKMNKMKNNKQLKKQNNEWVVVNQNGKIVGRATQDNFIVEFLRDKTEWNGLSTYQLGGEQPYQTCPQFVADNSENGLEIAQTLLDEIADGPLKNKSMIEQHLIGRKITRESFNRFGDRNNITGGFALGWFLKAGEAIDVVAMEIESLIYDTVENRVSPQDIVDAMMNNPSNYAKKRTDEVVALEERFTEITGFRATKKNIEAVCFQPPTLPLTIEEMNGWEIGEIEW